MSAVSSSAERLSLPRASKQHIPKPSPKFKPFEKLAGFPKPDVPSPPIASPAATRVVLISTNWRNIDKASTHVAGAEPAPSRKEIHEDVAPDGSIECLAFPTFYSEDEQYSRLSEFARTAKLVLGFLEASDMHQDNFGDLLRCATICHEANPDTAMVFLFARNITSVPLRSTCITLSAKFPHSFFALNLIWGDKGTLSLLTDIIKNSNNLLAVGALRQFTSGVVGPTSGGKRPMINNIPVFQTHPNFPVTSAPRAAGGAVASSPASPAGDPTLLSQAHREKAAEVLKAAIQEYNFEQDSKEYEQLIFEESGGHLQDYIAAICHERIRMKNRSAPPFTSSEAVLGKRKRVSDAIINKDRETQCVPVKWIIKRRDTFSHLFSPVDEAYSCFDASPEITALFESRFLDPQLRKETFSVPLNEGETASLVNLERMMINHIPNSLDRRLTIDGHHLDTPDFWVPQTKGFHKVELDPMQPLYKEIKDRFMQSMPEATLCSITQLQHCYQQLSYLHLCGQIEVAHNSKDLEERRLFHGSWTTPPDSIQKNSQGFSLCTPDPDPNDNWGRGIHLSEEAWYADERAFTYGHEDGTTHRQIFMADTQLGQSQKISPDPTLRRAPLLSEINHMPVYYDSVKGIYVKRDRLTGQERKATVHVVYKSEQVRPSFLLDYTLPSPPLSSPTL